MSTTTTSTPLQSCRYSNNLQISSISPNTLFDDWASGIRVSACHSRQVLVQAIEKLHPQFLDGTFDEYTAGPHPDLFVWVSVDRKCRVVISRVKNGRGRRVVDLQLYYSFGNVEETEPQRSLLQIKTAGDIALVPGDAQMWYFLRKCLHECMNEHELCKAEQDPAWYPERLLHLTQTGLEEVALQLVQTKDHPPASRYLALSHCWGTTPLFRTTSHNLLSHLQEISFTELPRTFQDCMTTARELDVQYIWIDSLCIIQDDHDDWARHAQIMDKIYEHALLTVAAVDSSDSSIPFLGPEAPSDRDEWQAFKIDITALNKTQFQQELKARKFDLNLGPGFLYGPLESRGWAWQERYLSARIINFTQHEAQWHCNVSETCVCIGVMRDKKVGPPKPSPAPRNEEKKNSVSSQWQDIVTEYSKRHLTYDTDRLPALSGVASRFQKMIQSEYLAGIWLSDLLHSLAWYHREVSDSFQGKVAVWRSLDNGVPTWSWASISGEVFWIWDYCFDDPGKIIPLTSQIEILSTSCIPSSDNKFGEVKLGSYVKVRGKVVEAEMVSDVYGCACVVREGFNPQHVIPDCHVISSTDVYRAKAKKRKALKSLFTHNEPKVKSAATKTTMRRAIPTEILDHDLSNGKKSKGSVLCLLLFTTIQGDKTHACILILGKREDGTDMYERLGIGCDDSGWSGPLYKYRKDWEVWQGWEELEEWQNWEDWFKDAEERTVTIV